MRAPVSAITFGAALLALTVVSVGDALAVEPTVLGQLATSMQSGTWAALKSEGYGEELLRTQGSWILDYADSGVWDPGSQQVLFVGQGHYTALKFITYSARDNVWAVMPTPPWWNGDPQTGQGPIGHAYGNNAIDPVGGVFYFHQSATLRVHRYRIARQEWSTLPAIPRAVTGHGTALVYFPEMRGLLRVLAGSIHFYSDAKSSWSLLADRLPMGYIHNVATYSAPRKTVIIGGGNDSRILYEIDARGKITRLPDAPVVVRVSSTVVTVDPVTGDLLVLNTDREKKLFSLDMQRREWKSLPDPPISEGVAVPIATYGVNLFFSGLPARVHLYKHPSRPQ
jgi:hypothetical protein